MKTTLTKLISLMNIGEFRIEANEESGRLNIFIEEDYVVKKNLSNMVQSLSHLCQLMAKKSDSPFHTIDINNYRLERERLIIELARAASRKAIMSKKEISLPIMNGYERRLIHMELAMRPDVSTESIGEGKERYVIIKPISD